MRELSRVLCLCLRRPRPLARSRGRTVAAVSKASRGPKARGRSSAMLCSEERGEGRGEREGEGAAERRCLGKVALIAAATFSATGGPPSGLRPPFPRAAPPRPTRRRRRQWRARGNARLQRNGGRSAGTEEAT